MKGSYHCGHVSNAKRRNARRKAPNPLRIDPTRTAGLRRAFMAAVRRKFRKLAVEVVKLIRDEDALGLLPTKSFSFNSIAANNRWKYQSDPEKVKAFKAWLKSQIASQIIGKDEEELWKRYVEEGFRKGAARAFDDTKKPLKAVRDQSAMDFYAGSKDAFLRSAFGRPVAIEKVKLLAGRSFDDLEGITERMSRDMVRGLTDGLVRGMGPREIARELADDVGISQGRALLVARTEIVRAFADGQLTALEELGVEEVGVMVEWSTSGLGETALGNPSPCEKCAEMQGVVLKIDEARGLIPLHPGCLCSWIPANVNEDTKDQTRGKSLIESAFGAADITSPSISERRPTPIF